MNPQDQAGIAESQNRLRAFARFFKGYMGVMPLVTAAVAPLLTLMKAIPVYESQKAALATYSGLLGFLLLAWVFYARSAFAHAMIPRTLVTSAEVRFKLAFSIDGKRTLATLLPLMLILLSIASYMWYNQTLDESIQKMAQTQSCANISRSLVLEKCGDGPPIFGGAMLQVYYLGIFLSAELAFVVMALREYAYGILQLSEAEILRGFRNEKAEVPAP